MKVAGSSGALMIKLQQRFPRRVNNPAIYPNRNSSELLMFPLESYFTEGLEWSVFCTDPRVEGLLYCFTLLPVAVVIQVHYHCTLHLRRDPDLL